MDTTYEQGSITPAWLSRKLSGFRKLIHQLWCKQNPFLTDVSEQHLADQKQYLLTSGKLTESELEEIKREAEQGGTNISGLSSVTTNVCAGVRMSTLDAFSDFSPDISVDTPSHVNCVSHSTAWVRKAPVARGENSVLLMMQEDHQYTNYLGNGSFDQPVTVLSGDCKSMDGTLDSVQCRATKESPTPSVSMNCDLMTTHPSTASRLEKIKTLTSQISSVNCQTKDGLSLDSDAAVDPVLCREFLEELQKKVRQIPICGDNAFQESL